MRRTRTRFWAWTAAAALGLCAVPAAAQEPDVRQIRPDVMLLMETSYWMMGGGEEDGDGDGEMEWEFECEGGTARSRWLEVVEVLTGQYANYQCDSNYEAEIEVHLKAVPALSTIDVETEQKIKGKVVKTKNTYSFDRHDGPGCLSPALPVPAITFDSQATNGILDTFAESVKFGWMTEDSCNSTATTDAGMWSYGSDRSFVWDGSSRSWNLGGRNTKATRGMLISVGPGADDTAALAAINSSLQEAVAGMELRGTNPLSALIDDARTYFTTHTDITADPYQTCRARAAIVVATTPAAFEGRETGAGAPPACVDPNCPYPLTAAAAANLNTSLANRAGNGGGVFVVGYQVDGMDGCAPPGRTANCIDPTTHRPVPAGAITKSMQTFDQVALSGGTIQARFAANETDLSAVLSEILSPMVVGATSRTRTVVTPLPLGAAVNGQAQFNSGFRINAGRPWTGILERTRLSCDGLSLVTQPVSQASGDDFAYNLNQRNLAGNPRDLWTFLLTKYVGKGGRITKRGVRWGKGRKGGKAPGDHRDYLFSDDGSPENFKLANLDVTPGLLNAKVAERDGVINYVHGEAGTLRNGYRLGDIYHSQPAIGTAPTLDLPDTSFQAFKNLLTVKNRPRVLYVGTNDGIFHAFDVDTGAEMWGFIPPWFLGTLRDQMPASHRFFVDGEPVVRDVLMERFPGTIPAATDWSTVVLANMRRGGNALIALDVTDPTDPLFMWQFYHSGMGLAYGTPAIGVVFTDWDGRLAERSIALVPGGLGEIDTKAPPRSCKLKKRPKRGKGGSRALARCYQNLGRYLWAIDLGTGAVIREFDFNEFDVPVVGSPVFFQGSAGAVATRAFFTDQEGIVYRIDFSDHDPDNWAIEALYDPFADRGDGEMILAQPVLTVDPRGRVTLIAGSGDSDNLASTTVVNRVFSISEAITINSAGLVSDLDVAENWVLSLDAGEKLTGPLTLLDGIVYFTSFVPSASGSQCDYGFGRIWGVDYLTTVDGTSTTPPLARYDHDDNPATAPVRSAALDSNTVSFGVGLVRRPTCDLQQAFADPVMGVTNRIAATAGGGFQMVTQTGGAGTRESNRSTGTRTANLPTPSRYVRIDSWASILE